MVLVLACAAGVARADADVVETTEGLAVRAAPDGRADHRGAVIRGARFRVEERRRGPGCKAEWLRIARNAWVCGDRTRPSAEAPGAPILPRAHEYVVGRGVTFYPTLEDAAAGRNGERRPGEVGLAVAARKRRDGREFVRTSQGWVDAAEVRAARPSSFRGVALDGATRLPIAFVGPGGAAIRDTDGRPLASKRLPRHHVLTGLAAPTTLRDGRAAYPVDGGFVHADDLRIVEPAPRPEGVGADERWIDVHLARQTLVIYEGDRPIYATLVSTQRNTPEGVHRITKKRPHVPMASTERYSEENRYLFETPWVMTLIGRYAMHSVYWHEEFGDRRGHGCVNLSPADADAVWRFTEPAMPPGWAWAEGQGSVVRIRR